MRLPIATYRLQFREGMDFDRAAGLAPYLAALGISHLYASPLFQATSGSTHGYDVTDHGRFDAALGGMDGFLRLSRALKENGLGLILDIVPNHMAASVENPWWADVLRHGRYSPYARHFDIDWDAPRLVLPVLGRPYGEALAAGELTLANGPDGPELRYYDHAFPLSPESRETIAEAGGPSGDPDLVHRVHELQAYRLAYWRLGRDGLTYRRFFEVSDLVGVRVEDERVFDDVHHFLFDLVADGHVDGVRIDHVDGLADPTGYLRTLAARLPRRVPVWIEKIVHRGEVPPEDWPVAGMTGYEFGDMTNAALTDAEGAARLAEAWRRYAAEPDYLALEQAAKHELLTRNLVAELGLLVTLAEAALAPDPAARDWGRDSLRRGLVALLTKMPVYRTYLAGGTPSLADRRILDGIRRDAEGTEGLEDPGVLDALLGVLLTGTGDAATRLRARFQQTSGALMAKAVEDTLFYRFNALLSANEVGGNPAEPAIRPPRYLDWLAKRWEDGTAALNATATHDTKRGEDARMRIAAIADDAGGWCDAVGRFDAALGAAADAVDPSTRWLFYQALLGSWTEDPDEALPDRLKAYLVKAAREAKRHTVWTNVDEAYEDRLTALVDAALGSDGFRQEFRAAAAPVLARGDAKSLAQTALKLFAPGIPDIYQGTEFADLSLVDPDNRRPVDFDRRRRALQGEADLTDFERDKLGLLRFGLALRREHAAFFEQAAVAPLDRPGGGVGFVRSHGGLSLTVSLGPDAGVEAPPAGARSWTGGSVAVVFAQAEEHAAMH